MMDDTLFDATTNQWGHTRFEPHVFIANNAKETSRDAAQKVLPKSGTQRAKVYDAIKAAGESGLTDAEVLLHVRINGNSIRPRRLELVEQGLIEAAGQRNGFTIWRAVA